MPIPPIGGGGGLAPPSLNVTPFGAITFGNVAVGSSKDVVVTVTNGGDTTTAINTIVLGIGAPFSLIGVPSLPARLDPGAQIQFTIRYSPVATVTSNDSFTITALAGTDNSPYTAALSGTGASAVVAALQFTPGPVVFPNTVVTKTATPIVVTIKNVGGAATQITAIALANGTLGFTLSALPGLPLTMNPNDTTTLTVNFTPLLIQSLSDTLQITTSTIGVVTTAVQGMGVQITPIATIINGDFEIVFGIAQGVTGVPVTAQLDGSNNKGFLTSAGSAAGSLIFNGTVWDAPGYEKKLRRVMVWHENLGVAALTCTVTVQRPSLGPDVFDSQTQSINIGTALADLTERTAFFDIQIAGEIINIQISRPQSGGALALLGFLPMFEEGGEKVENR